MSELAKLRKNHNLTQKKLAESLQISPKSITAYENGYRTPSPQVMQKIEDYFGVPKEVIFSTAFCYYK
ncbi:helix-turn-helix transcriptional regulator [Ligilactobacillus sp. WILCCON 0076]|uniref:Helix-turn-helix transcriptional regulator n=1 Tax=Ligilactobacillus ubinensis TaxID=2876789 RepID=A0A9X2JLU1_9LACO|nr:helix-turn-helix transcriptional regulator [Ligilactobacillus ubinensis]MCP0886965.1 helix-turn-helix transcriptional regulator [Ligilactobacillus ubinensis]